MSERRLSIPCGDFALEGALRAPEGTDPIPAVVVCHPHPQYGGDMHNSVVMAVVEALTGQGIASLRFNFRGVGRSGGRYEGGNGEQEDVRAALAHAAGLPEVDAARLGLAGYSFGAMVAARSVTEQARALALVAPPLGMAPDIASGLTAYPRPILLVAGEEDHVCPSAALRTLAETLGSRAEAHVVPDADHFWYGWERELIDITGSFFGRQLKGDGNADEHG